MAPLRKLIIPVAFILAALLFRERLAELYGSYGQLLEWLPYLALGIGIALCIFYNLSRVFTLTLALLVSYYLIQTQLQGSLTDPRALFIYTSLSIALPLTALILLLAPERGLNNFYGFMVVAIVPLQAAAAAMLYTLSPADVIESINQHLPPAPMQGYILSAPASAWFLLVAAAGLYRLVVRDTETIALVLVMLLFGFVTLALLHEPRISTTMFSLAGLSITISLIRNSYNMAYRDELTGLFGRRALNDRLKGLGRRYVIAMLDVDHFKKFNDRYGHDVGDDVLKMVASKIGAVQGGGIPYRYGGEEFSILFPGKTIDECEPFLEVVRKTVENHKLVVRNIKQRPKTRDKDTAILRRGRRQSSRGNKTVSLTISIGVAERNEKHTSAGAVLKAADGALYRAKENGRNQIAVA